MLDSRAQRERPPGMARRYRFVVRPVPYAEA